MERCRPQNMCMPPCNYMPSCKCMPSCEPMPEKCMRRCIGTYTTKYRIYANCSYEICKVCPCCGHEYMEEHHHECPMCGAPAGTHFMNDDDPPGDPDGFGEIGGFGRNRFGFFPSFSFFPFFPFFFPFSQFRRRRY